MMRRGIVILFILLVGCQFEGGPPPIAPPRETPIETVRPTSAAATAAAAEATRRSLGNVSYTARYEVSECPPPAARYTSECGVLIVPQDRANPDDLSVRLPVAIVRGYGAVGDPVVYLSGGPGSVAIDVMGYHFSTGQSRFLDGHDYIFFDQRGTGYAEPSLQCPEVWAVTPRLLSEPLSDSAAHDLELEAYEACFTRLRAEGIEPAHYSSAASAADLADLLSVLGYEQAHLFGVSYGTRLALTAIRDHPETVATAILDSPSSPPQADLYATYTSRTKRALDVVFAACAAQAGCNQTYPNLRGQFYGTLRALNDEPIITPVQNRPAGEVVQVRVTGDVFARTLRDSMIRWDNIQRVPLTVAQMERGVISGYLERLLERPFSRSGSEGVRLSVLCNEALAFSSMEAVRAGSADVPDVLNNAFFDAFRVDYAVCDLWEPVANPLEAEPITSDIPVLIFVGEADPITPPEWGYLLAETLPNATVVEFPAMGHWITRSGDAGLCAMGMSLAFIASPEFAIDTRCVEALPPLRFP